MGLRGSKPKNTIVHHDRVKDWVDAYLKTHGHNMPFIPDFIERSIYMSVLSLLLTLLHQGDPKIVVEMAGHRIQLDIQTTVSPLTSHPIQKP